MKMQNPRKFFVTFLVVPRLGVIERMKIWKFEKSWNFDFSVKIKNCNLESEENWKVTRVELLQIFSPFKR